MRSLALTWDGFSESSKMNRYHVWAVDQHPASTLANPKALPADHHEMGFSTRLHPQVSTSCTLLRTFVPAGVFHLSLSPLDQKPSLMMLMTRLMVLYSSFQSSTVCVSLRVISLVVEGN